MTKKRQTLNPDLQDLKVACNIKSIIYICLIPFIVLFKYELIHVLCLSLPLLSLSLSLSLSADSTGLWVPKIPDINGADIIEVT